MAKKSQTEPAQGPAIVEALFRLAEAKPWHDISMADIARQSGLELSALLALYDGKTAILHGFHQSLDDAVLRGGLPADDESPRDRLFEVIMRRIDAMQPHKAGLRAIFLGGPIDPWLFLCGAPGLLRSAGLMLEAAGISSWGPSGHLKAKGLAAIYLATLRAWLRDDSADSGKTMAVLDRSLRRAENVVLSLRNPWRLPSCGRANEAGQTRP